MRIGRIRSPQLGHFHYLTIWKILQGPMFSAESSYDEDKVEKVSKPPLKLNQKNKVKSAFAVSQKNEICTLCKSSHFIHSCTLFLSKSAYDRYNSAEKIKLCFVCLTGDHGTRSCSNTLSPYKCSCGKLHHHLFHSVFSVRAIDLPRKVRCPQ